MGSLHACDDIFYHLLVFGTVRPVFPANFAIGVQEIREPALMNTFSLLRLANITCEIRKDDEYDYERERVWRFGRRWRARYIMDARFRVSQLTSYLTSDAALT